MRVLSKFLIPAAIASLTSATVFADIEVGQDEDIWTITAAGEPLSEVLSAIREEAGFTLVGADRLIDNHAVTIEVSGSLGDVLARILAGFDYALVYGETPETSGELQRLVLLSGRAGDAPDESQRLTVERLPDGLSEEDGERVSDLLARQVQPLIDAEESGGATSNTQETTALTAAPASPSSDPATTGGDDYELDPETQAALAEATRRAQQDLQALVNALQAAEDGDN